jgi:hypothetical protein
MPTLPPPELRDKTFPAALISFEVPVNIKFNIPSDWKVNTSEAVFFA